MYVPIVIVRTVPAGCGLNVEESVTVMRLEFCVKTCEPGLVK